MTHAKKRNRVYVHPRRSGMLPGIPGPADERSGLICEWGDCEAQAAPGSERCEAHQDRDPQRKAGFMQAFEAMREALRLLAEDPLGTKQQVDAEMLDRVRAALVLADKVKP